MKIFFLACLVLVSLHSVNCYGEELLELNKVKVLEFRYERKTVERYPISQVICTDRFSERLCNLFKPQIVTCENVGYPSRIVAWDCKADLYEGIEFDGISVLCDHHTDYDWREKNKVIKGSCHVDFSLRKNGNH